MDQVGIGMAAAEILPRLAVHHRAGRCAEALLQDLPRVGPGHRVHGVEAHLQRARCQLVADQREVEQAFHERGVVRDRVDHLDVHAAEPSGTDQVQVDGDGVQHVAAVDLLCAGIDRLGHLLRGRATVRNVVLDAEVLVRPAGVVAGRQDQAAECLVATDDAGGGRCRQDAAPPHHHLSETVGRGHPEDGLDGFAVEEPSVAADHQGLAPEIADHVEYRLDEVLQIARLPENADLLAQPGCPGTLPFERRRGDTVFGSVHMARLSVTRRSWGVIND